MNTRNKLSGIAILLVVLLVGLFSFTTPASAMTCSSATLDGEITSGTLPIRARFTYGTSYNTVASGGGIPTTVQTFNSYEGVQQFISGLSESTTYYFRPVSYTHLTLPT